MPRYIDVDALKDSLIERYCDICKGACCALCRAGYIFQEIKSAPAADVEPVRHGRWKRIQWVKDEDWQEGGYWILRCSECVMPYHNPTPYCPHCGAKMQGEDGND